MGETKQGYGEKKLGEKVMEKKREKEKLAKEKKIYGGSESHTGTSV